jgi:hypothetical protein
MHSGWGVLVAVSGNPDELQIAIRDRIVVMDSTRPRGNQPYHFARQLETSSGGKAAQEHLGRCAALSEGMALTALTEIVQQLQAQQYRIAGAVILTSAGRSLPSLSQILASHPLIHTAEGEFFRSAVRRACETLGIPTETIREKDLQDRAKHAYGSAAGRVQKSIASLGKSIGPPWTSDHKNATLAAAFVLRGK